MIRYIHTRVYLKPLLPAGRPMVEPDKVLRRSKRDLLRRLRQNLFQTTFSDAAKKALARALSVEIRPSSLRITANHPAFRPLVMGQRKAQMTWLTKARAPIPIILDSGKLIFRSATPRSMENGSWWHPGRQPSNFVDKAKKQTRQFIKDKLKKELVSQLRNQGRRALLHGFKGE
jgi:hypothetical protein